MKLEIRVGVDFEKLANDVPKLLDGFLKGSIDETVKESKNFIRSGRVTPDILPQTKARRKRSGNPESPPLYETGKLHNSIEGTKDGIMFNGYGIVHQRGIDIQQRQFLAFSQAKDGIKKLVSAMRKSLRRSSPLVLKT